MVTELREEEGEEKKVARSPRRKYYRLPLFLPKVQ
jgi:hypothetical protein